MEGFREELFFVEELLLQEGQRDLDPVVVVHVKVLVDQLEGVVILRRQERGLERRGLRVNVANGVSSQADIKRVDVERGVVVGGATRRAGVNGGERVTIRGRSLVKRHGGRRELGRKLILILELGRRNLHLVLILILELIRGNLHLVLILVWRNLHLVWQLVRALHLVEELAGDLVGVCLRVGLGQLISKEPIVPFGIPGVGSQPNIGIHRMVY